MQTNRYLIWTGVIGLILTFLSYIFFDKAIVTMMLHISSHNIVYKISLFIGKWFGSQQTMFVAILIGVIGGYFSLRKKPILSQYFTIVFLSYFMIYIITFILKFILGRYRPELFIKQNLYGFSWFQLGHQFTSMPSGHAAVNFALGLSIAILIMKRFRILAILLIFYSVIVAISRVVIKAHYPSDVLLSLTISTWSIAFILRNKIDN